MVGVGPLGLFGRLALSVSLCVLILLSQNPRQSSFGDLEYIRGYSCAVVTSVVV